MHRPGKGPGKAAVSGRSNPKGPRVGWFRQFCGRVARRALRGLGYLLLALFAASVAAEAHDRFAFAAARKLLRDAGGKVEAGDLHAARDLHAGAQARYDRSTVRPGTRAAASGAAAAARLLRLPYVAASADCANRWADVRRGLGDTAAQIRKATSQASI
ncbi:hypothetical protein M885DRAFT_536271 [Pelagophyceae sp. CCMP2097]|nr:hypothetical protein M885DRAFT_536271 [Pelagophyceae sp. CCMP2097]